MLRRIFSQKYLWLTNTLSSGSLLALGDGIQQQVERHRGTSPCYNWSRTGRMFCVGLMQGPPHHLWYTWLDKVLPQRQTRTIMYKILADQLLAAPFFAVTFFLGMGLMEGRCTSDVMEEFQKKFPAVYLFDWCIWPPSQYINFYYVPGQYRVLYVNGITVLWDVFLSYIKHYDQPLKKKSNIT